MKKIRNNVVNRIFHKKEVERNTKRKHECEKLIVLETEFLDRIGSVTFDERDINSAKVTGAQSLLDVLNIHKKAWVSGFQNKHIGPSCEYGMFRTKDIPTMQPHEVFLGDIWGILTRSIPYFEGIKYDEKVGGGYYIFDYLTVYQIVLDQYKRHLSNNIKTIAKQAKKELDELFSLGY